MKNPTRLIKISSLIHLLSALFFIPSFTVFGGILLTMGVILLSYSFLSIDQLKKKKAIIMLIAIISIFIGLIVGVILFVALDEISSFKIENDNAPPEDEITSEAKRIDLLLKIGLIMILISGVLFATTSWDVMSDIFKIFGLLAMGGIFLGLSKFSEEKLKIEKTTKAYYILGLAFFLLTWVGIGVFGTISPAFSYTGELKNLVYFITFIILGVVLHLINKKFPSKEYEYFFYICGYLSIYHFLTFIGFNLMLTTIVISTISLLINVYIKDNKYSSLSELTNIMSYLYTPIIITQSIDSQPLLVIIVSIINIVNVLYLATKTADKIDNVLSIIISYTLMLTSILVLELSLEVEITLLFIFISILYYVINHNKFNTTKHIMNTNQIIYNTVAIYLTVFVSDSLIQKVILSVAHTMINYVNCYITNEDRSNVDKKYQPLIIFVLISNFINIIDYYLFYVNEIYNYLLSAVVYATIHYFASSKKIKRIYYIALSITAILSTIINVNEGNIIVGLILIPLAFYMYFSSRNFKESTKIWAYIFVLINILCFSNALYMQEVLSKSFSSLFVLIVYGVLTYVIKEKNIKTVNYIAIIVPLYDMVNSLTLHEELKMIFDNIFGLYFVFLIVTLIVKDRETKDIVSTIGTSLVVFTIIFEQSILTGLYVGLLGIGIILLTYNKKSYKKLFYCGVVIVILNIIIQIGEYWAMIPLWLYLLLAGGSIVAFVTYKEVNKKNEPPKAQKRVNDKVELPKKQENHQEKEIEEVFEEKIEEKAEFCPFCGTKNPGGNYCLNCGKYLIITKNKKN